MVNHPDFNKLNEQAQLKIRFSTETEMSQSLFKEEVKKSHQKISDKFQLKLSGDQHVWISFTKKHRKLYSPQLHLEYIKEEKEKPIIKGTFGPDPNLWTMFMFFHFFLAIVFIALLMWFYTNYSLGNSNAVVYSLMATISLLWIGLYIFARQNRLRGKEQTKELFEIYKIIVH
ncbi:hypothetical protein [Psychroflexus halocasei]|uniref:GTP-binding protein n=1 Tax=Psychroflexus halocasei TaxID=908615 RepID=A0A1H4AK06_9FLAO|nr:hypothetical protein [Psychroflexus halocasei]SEA36240.1 hypothetical protein SAMN05421540_10562 [Psychroflexus halocasei]